MKTIVELGIRYQIEEMQEVTKGFWLWKRKVLQPKEPKVKRAFFLKEQEIPASATKVRVPVLGNLHIVERIVESGHLTVWLGNHGIEGIDGWGDFTYISQDTFESYKNELIADGFEEY